MAKRKEKPRCTNCNDETTFPRHCDGMREKKGWCVPCYSVWKRESYQTRDGKEELFDRERTIADRTPFDSGSKKEED